MAERTDCLFCRIVDGEIPADVVRRGERVLAFRDLNPQAPTHVLVIPLRHYADVTALAAGEPEALAELVAVGAELARDAVASGQAQGNGAYRLVFNTGAAVGQSVFHTHGHVLAGRPFGWPPG